MLADFQQALADLVADPDRCVALRAAADPAPLLTDYDLTEREVSRLVGMVRHQGMATNCTVYRSNRLTPLVVNLPDTCAALGPHLRDVVDRFWAACPTEYFVHFLIESDRFARFVGDELAADRVPSDVRAAVTAARDREAAVIDTRLADSLAARSV